MADLCRNVVVMGVCGVGKSTVARRLAEACGGHFVEGDGFHSQESVRAMSSGIPLSDEVRMGWLDRIGEAVQALNARDDAPVFIACSALKLSYRARLRRNIGALAIVHLGGDPDLIRERLDGRKDHFMPTSLLGSQLGALEPPEAQREGAVLRLNIALPVEEVVERAVQFCRRQVASAGRSDRGKQPLSAGNIHDEN